MKKAKLLTLLAVLTVGLGATGCAMPDFLYTTVEGHQHTLAHYYSATRHWDECTECGERFNVEDHVYGEVTHTETTHSAVCDVCGYGLVEEHTYTYVSLDEESHAKYCEFCSYYAGVEDHNLVLTPVVITGYEDPDDPDSEVSDLYGHVSRCACGYEADDFTEHTEAKEYTYDSDYHYKVCSECGYVLSSEAHEDTFVYSVPGIYGEDESEYYGFVIVRYECNICGNTYTRTYDLDEETYNEYFGE